MDGGKSETSTLPLEELEARITELCGHLNAAHYRWLLLIREFDRRRGWGDGKLASCAPGQFRVGIRSGPPDVRLLIGYCVFGSPDAALLVSLLPQIVRVRGERRLGTLVQSVRFAS